jgi:thiol-disulfide isomerase/thioredoxin
MYLNGERMFLRDYCGELRFTPNSPHKYPVVLSFFSTTCQPCKVEIKELHLLAEKFHEKVKFFLIAVGEEKDPVYAHITAQKYTIPVLLDQYLIVSGKYGDAQVVPKLVLVDMEGKIRLFKMGYEPKNIKELEELLEQLTQEKGK